MIAATFLIGIYGGYFTAAQGIMLIAALGVIVPDDLQRMNAVRIIARRERGGRGHLHDHRVRPDQLGRSRTHRRRLTDRRGPGRPLRTSPVPTALRATIVVVGLIGLVRLLLS